MHKLYPPIEIRPLTLRGVFGIAGKLVRRRTGALIGYHALYALFVFLAMLPGTLAMVLSGISMEAASGSDTFSGIAGLFGGFFLVMLALLAVSLLFTPILSGTVYGEMSARIYGQASSFSEMMRRSKFSLKRFFTTYLCNMVAAWGISFAVTLVTSLFGGFVLLFALIGSVVAITEGTAALGAGAIIAFVCVYLLVLALAVAAGSLLSFVFPAAVNEPLKNFAAVGRSMKLVWKRLGRVVGSMLILNGIVFIVALIFSAAMAVAELLPTMAAVLVIILASLLYIGLLLFLSLYQPAITTVLYFDARARLEGTTFPAPAPAAPAPAAPVTPAAPVPSPVPVAPEPAVNAAAEPDADPIC